jgi:hypothetical protein
MKTASQPRGAEPPRRRATVIEDPLFVVTEGTDGADPQAVLGALEIIVRWAVRAHEACNTRPAEETAVASGVACSAGERT